MLQFLKENWELVTGGLGAVIAFFGGRKSKKQNEKTTELENIEKVRAIEKKLLEDMDDRINDLIKYNEFLEGVVEKCKKKLAKYVDLYGELKDYKE